MKRLLAWLLLGFVSLASAQTKYPYSTVPPQATNSQITWNGWFFSSMAVNDTTCAGGTATAGCGPFGWAGSVTGSTTGGAFGVIQFSVTSDTFANTGANSLVNALDVEHTFGGSGAQGGFSAGYFHLVQGAQTSNTNGQYGALGATARGNYNEGGTSGTAAGLLYGINPNVGLQCITPVTECATFWQLLNGEEIDIQLYSGASVLDKIGLQVVEQTNDASQASRTDVAISLNNATGASGWQYGLLFGSYAGLWPMNANGTLIGCYPHANTGACGTTTNGINFTNITFTGDAFESTGYSVDGSGNESALSLKLTGNISTAAALSSGVGMITSTPTYTDSSGTGGTITSAYMYAFPAPNLETTTATTYTNLANVYIPAPTSSTGGGGTPTVTNVFSLLLGGGLEVGASSQVFWAGRAQITSPATNTIRLGTANGSSPVAYTLNSQGGSGSNIAGANLTVQSGQGTGNATGSNLILQTPHAGTTGSSAQTMNSQITLGDNTVAINQITTGTNADFVCLSSSQVLLIQSSACTISSLRFKEAVNPFTGDAREELERLAVKSYQMKDDHNRDPNAVRPQIGLIAENVAAVEPKCAIYENDLKTPKSYRPECITALLVKATQENNAVVRQHLELIYALLACVGLLVLHGGHLHMKVRRLSAA